MAEQKKPSPPEATVGRTPGGKILTETPQTMRPSMESTWGVAWQYLGNPSNRYGRLVSPRQISVSTKMLMLMDPIIAICVAYIASKLVKAEWEIRCADERIRYFFEVMAKRWHAEFMQQVALASAIGYLPLVKKYRFETPTPEDPKAPPAWTQSAVPYICTGFDQAWPVGAVPDFDKDNHFTGFTHAGGKVDRIWALWMSLGKVNAFGKYSGLGRLCYAYKAWWLSEFNYDQFAVHLQKAVNRVVKVGYPDGKTKDGQSNSDIAIAIGNDIRGGATVAVPTATYDIEDEMTGQVKPSNIAMWTAAFMEGTENVGAFIENANHFDSRKALGMMIPYQTLMQVQQSSLGGPTTADVLGRLATDMILLHAGESDRHLNEYVFPYLTEVNFGAGAPAVTKRTIGLNESDRAELFEVVKALINRVEATAGEQVDERRVMDSLGIPLREPGDVPEPPPPEEPLEEEELAEEPPEAGAAVGATQVDPLTPNTDYDPTKNPSREALEKMLSEPVPGITDQEAEVTESDIERAIAWLDEHPEVSNLETSGPGGE